MACIRDPIFLSGTIRSVTGYAAPTPGAFLALRTAFDFLRIERGALTA
jgi:hypothetical protein